MAVTPQYASPSNESGEPHAPLYWVEGYGEDDQLGISSYGGEPYRRGTGETLPPDPGSPGWDPSQGFGEIPPVVALSWAQTDPNIVWTDVDPTVPWIGDIAVVDTVTTSLVSTFLAPMDSGAFAASYPNGISLFSLSAAEATDDGAWPAPRAAQVMSVRSASDRIAQFWFDATAGSSEVWYRTVGTSTAGPWLKVADDPIPIPAQVLTAPIASSALSGAYPQGFSAFNVSTADSTADGGWPSTGSVNVFTIKTTSTLMAQFCFQARTDTPNVWYRTLAATGVSAWTQIVGQAEIAQILAAPPASAAFLAAYPTGMSIAAITTAQATADGGWPLTTSSQLLTVKSATDRGAQFWFRNSTATTETWYRQLGATVNSPWVQLVGGQQYRAQNSTTNQNLTSGVWTLLTITGAETAATSAGTDIVLSGNGMAVARDGLYEVSILVTWNGGMTTGAPIIGLASLAAAGAEGFYRQQVSANAQSTSLVQSATFLRHMNAGDTLGVWALQASGSTQSVGTRRFVIRRLSD